METGKIGDGYGEKDREMAAGLRAARTPQDADRIARDNGLRDGRDAASWLRERTSPARSR